MKNQLKEAVINQQLSMMATMMMVMVTMVAIVKGEAKAVVTKAVAAA